MAKNKKRTPVGRTLQTKDNYFEGQSSVKPKDRRVVVVEVNDNDELGVVGLTSKKHKNSTRLDGYKSKDGVKTHYKHFVEVRDDKGKPIVKGNKFRENHPGDDVSAANVVSIRKTVYSQRNKAKQRNDKNKGWLYGRNKKKTPK